MNKFLVLVGSVLAVFVGLVVGGYQVYGFPGAFAGFLAFMGLLKLAVKVVKRRFVQLGKALFESKSMVLRGAKAEVHKVEVAPPAAETDPEAEPSERPKVPTKFYFVDVTITPAMQSGATPFTGWDSTELRVVPWEAVPPTFESGDAEEWEGDYQVHRVSVLDECAESENGQQRLKLHVEVPEGKRRLKFQYYFEMFGEVTIPS